MCGCERHHDRAADCTCICPEHGNFQRAYDLAMSRYDDIVALRESQSALRAELDALRGRVAALAGRRDVVFPERFKFGAEDNYFEGYRTAQADLLALLDGPA
jgi:hypothetical protein